MKNLSNKVSYLAISVIMGAIIISFVLTGFQGFGSSAGQIASVDGTPITSREYNQVLSGMTERYSKMFGGKALTNKQIKMFRIRESALQQLVSQKHLLNFSQDLRFDAGKADIKDEIKNYEFFKTGGKFDVNKYKSLLQANRLSPAKFEEDIIKQIKSNRLRLLMASSQDSKTLSENMLRLRNLKATTLAVQFEKEAMTVNLNVPAKEVSAFATDKKNETLLKALYKTYEAEEAAAMKAKNPKAKVAVKAFNKVKKMLAKKHLQKSKRDELKVFNEKLVSDIEKALMSNNKAKLNSLKKKYNITYEAKYELSPFNTKFQNSSFNEDEVLALFKAKDTKKVLKVDTPTTVAMVKAVKFDAKKVEAKDLESEIKFSGQRNARVIESAIVDFKGKSSKVVTSANIFL